jgi:hypothetical protein
MKKYLIYICILGLLSISSITLSSDKQVPDAMPKDIFDIVGKVEKQSEIIKMQTAMIQKLYNKVEVLEAKVAKLEER